MPKFAFGGAISAALALSTIISLIIAPFVKHTALLLGIVDIPKDGRRMHCRPIPLMGGAGMIAAFCASALALAGDMYSSVLALLCAVCGVYGVLDDKFALRVPAKLAFQAAIAILAAFLLGGAEAFSFFGAEYPLGVFALPVSAMWLVFMMNAVNLTDGIDGLCAGTSAVSAAALCLLHSARGAGVPAVCAAALCGACIGFLFHNRAPAKIFMGETGSAFLGFALGALALPLFSASEPSALPAVLPVFLFPLCEAVGSFLRRAAAGKNPFAPDKKHMHHVLCGGGLCVPLVCAVLYAFAMLCAFCAVMYTRHAVPALASFALAVVFLRVILGRARRRATSARRPPPAPQAKGPCPQGRRQAPL